jgi:hypothetical protein
MFEGDTVVGFARFAEVSAQGPVVLEAELETGERIREELATFTGTVVESGEDISLVARIVAHAGMKEARAEQGLQTALRYRLLSPWTNWIATVERPEEQKAFNIPAIRKVPQVMASRSAMAGAFAGMMPAPPMPASAAPPRHPKSLFRGPVSDILFDLPSRMEGGADQLRSIESKDEAGTTEFLALVPLGDWEAIAEWASRNGHDDVAVMASEFANLLRSHRVADLTEQQIRDGMEVLKQAVRLGFRLSRAIIKEARRRGLLTS